MKPSRLLLAVAVAASLLGVVYVSHANESAGLKMTRAAERFIASLTAEERARATFAFDDDERLNWHFVPLQTDNKTPKRKGVRLEELSQAQRDAAMDLLRAGTSTDGFIKATTIMSLESILHDLEKDRGAVRSPGWYFYSIFGTPSRTGRWGWRVEGHHLSLNFVVDGGKVLSATPAFFGANPALVKDGRLKGTRILAEAENLARNLSESLSPDQQKMARQENQFPEVQGGRRDPSVGAPKGVPGSRMTERQRDLLFKLLESYTSRMSAEIAQAQMSDIRRTGLDEIYFAHAGELKDGSPHTYRVHGPTFVVEFLNVQSDSAGNPANHIHSALRNIKGDFGLTN